MCENTRKQECQHGRSYRSAIISKIYVEAKGLIETVIAALESGWNVGHAITCCKILSKTLDQLVKLI